MPCTVSRKSMAEAGFSEEEIEALEAEVALSRAKANIKAAERGMTKTQQQIEMDRAEKQTRNRIHDEMHARLDAAMAEIRAMGAAKKLPTH